ncbi:MAG: hypothetical protein WC761_00890 [Candidatus Paceibacterota bacterium]|jgi:hypothetical protein
MTNQVKPVIVVLDDDQQRVLWLKGRVGDRAQVLWSTTVKGLHKNLKAAENIGNLVLVFLDHDLDMWSSKGDSKDRNGEDGTDAARNLSLQDKSTPIVIWSLNGRAAETMEDMLAQRGFNVKRMMFLFKQVNAHTIDQILNSE